MCLKAADSDKPEMFVDEHSPEAIAAWAAKLHERFERRPIAVRLETKRGHIVTALLKHDIFVLFPVKPPSLACYRQA